jgi:NADH-quinone oxidoreductase subunit J
VNAGDVAEWVVFAIAALGAIAAAIGVVTQRNPVHAALSLVGTLFGVAVLFVLQEAHFLAAVQIIVYAGAIVVLFLFVIMLLGVDRAEDLSVEPLAGQRVAGVLMGALVLALALGGLFLSGPGGDKGAVALTGQQSSTQALKDDQPNVNQLSTDLFGRDVLAFEATALLLTIATVGAVVLVRNRAGPSQLMIDEPDDAVDGRP